MYNNTLSTYSVVTYCLTHLPMYRTLLLTLWVTNVKPDINSFQQLSHNGHPLDGALVGGQVIFGWSCLHFLE
jgi:hypothetical protein